jgi:hypothetical protein
MTIYEAIERYGRDALWCRVHGRPLVNGMDRYVLFKPYESNENAYCCTAWLELPQLHECRIGFRPGRKSSRSE